MPAAIPHRATRRRSLEPEGEDLGIVAPADRHRRLAASGIQF